MIHHCMLCVITGSQGFKNRVGLCGCISLRQSVHVHTYLDVVISYIMLH